jgi:hypothetical protein
MKPTKRDSASDLPRGLARSSPGARQELVRSSSGARQELVRTTPETHQRVRRFVGGSPDSVEPTLGIHRGLQMLSEDSLGTIGRPFLHQNNKNETLEP